MFVCRDFGIYKLRCSNFHSLNTYFVTQSFLWIFEKQFSKWQCTRLNGLNMINFMNHVFLPKGSYFATITLFIWAKLNFSSHPIVHALFSCILKKQNRSYPTVRKLHVCVIPKTIHMYFIQNLRNFQFVEPLSFDDETKFLTFNMSKSNNSGG